MRLARYNDGPEIFHSLQGEGPNRGHPCVFVRLSLCNLHCFWCDTDYTWNWKGTHFRHRNDSRKGYDKYSRESLILESTPAQVAKEVLRHQCDYIVITGGEPLLQQEEVSALLEILRSQLDDPRLEIETNGTIAANDHLAGLVDQFNVSPKLSSSGNSVAIAQKPTALNYFAMSPKSVFKFVLSSEEDIPEVLALVNDYSIAKRRTYLVPEAVTRESAKRKETWLAERCRELGFAYCDRLNISLYGDRRAT